MRVDSTFGTIGDLVAARPMAVRALQHHGIDWCCNPQSLDAACEASGIDVESLLEEMRRDEAGDAPIEVRESESLQELVDRIVREYHEPLYRELQRIEALAKKVVHAHGDRHGEQVWAILRTFEALREQLSRHMSQEEEALFPWLLGGSWKDLKLRLAPMQNEHASEMFLVKQLRQLTENYSPPPDACRTSIALYEALRKLESDLIEHTRLESDVLFARVRQEAELATAAGHRST